LAAVVAAVAAAQVLEPGRLPQEERVPESRSVAPDVKQAQAGVQLPRVPGPGPEPVLEPAQVPQPAARGRRVAPRPARLEALRTSDRSPTAER
jgi:hypothetical protein